jgi:2-isopropylmalate synthase
MNTNEKLRLAVQLEKLGVDIIEAGFPAASEGDFEAVSEIAKRLKRTEVAGLAGPTKATSTRPGGPSKRRQPAHPHLYRHLGHPPGAQAENESRPGAQTCRGAVKYAKTFTDNVEFSAEDGSRSDRDYLCKVFEAAIEAGATTVNLPDTVGYAIPEEFEEMVKYVMTHTPNIAQASVQRPLPQRSGAGHGQHPGRHQQRRPPGRSHHQRHRRARRQHLPGRGGHGLHTRPTTSCP